MTHKEKAQELVKRFQTVVITVFEYDPFCLTPEEAKQCALIAVDEIIKEIPDTVHGWMDIPTNIMIVDNPRKQYWQQVKKEIEIL